MTSRVILLLAILLTVTSLGLAQIDLSLNYHYGQEAEDILQSRSLYGCDLSDRPNDVKFPAFTASDPIFANWSVPTAAGGTLWLALDRSASDQPYDRLYVDADGDGDLSDEQPIHSQGKDNNNWDDFGPVKLSFVDEGRSVIYHLDIMFGSNGRFFIISSACCYEAMVSLEGSEYRVILRDRNNNGSFMDHSDWISIAPEGEIDYRVVGRYVEVNGALYELEILEHGNRVKLAQAVDVPLGQVQVPETIGEVQFISELGQFDRIVKDGKVTLPQGTHRINRWVMERKDEQGRQWRAVGSGFDEQGQVDITDGGVASLKIGEPFKSSLDVSTRRDGELYFSQDLTGQVAQSISLYVEGERAAAPQLHVCDKTGKRIETLNFEYG